MRWADIPLSPPRRTLRQFAALWTLFFGCLAAWEGWVKHHETAAAMLAVLAFTLGPLGMIKPWCIRPVFVGWMIVVFPIGWLVSHALLSALFFGVFTPIALAFRLSGRDLLKRRYHASATTYWMPKPAPRGPSSYFRQY
jgi:hypothetical protein